MSISRKNMPGCQENCGGAQRTSSVRAVRAAVAILGLIVVFECLFGYVAAEAATPTPSPIASTTTSGTATAPAPLPREVVNITSPDWVGGGLTALGGFGAAAAGGVLTLMGVERTNKATEKRDKNARLSEQSRAALTRRRDAVIASRHELDSAYAAAVAFILMQASLQALQTNPDFSMSEAARLRSEAIVNMLTRESAFQSSATAVGDEELIDLAHPYSFLVVAVLQSDTLEIARAAESQVREKTVELRACISALRTEFEHQLDDEEMVA